MEVSNRGVRVIARFRLLKVENFESGKKGKTSDGIK